MTTPMMQQHREAKERHPGMILLFRAGDFYELFYEDAVVASRALEIALTSRSKDREGEPIPMCGVPHHAVSTYVARLVKQGFRVALCEQMEDPRTARGVVKREVVRVIKPRFQTGRDQGKDAYLLELKVPESRHTPLHIHFLFNEDERAALADLAPGQRVVLQGQCERPAVWWESKEHPRGKMEVTIRDGKLLKGK